MAVAPPLGIAVTVALRALGDLAHVAAGVEDGRLEALLRASVASHRARAGNGNGSTPDPSIAVQTACAHLAAGDREDAYLALRTACDFLPPELRARPTTETDTAVDGLRRPEHHRRDGETGALRQS
jgi:hypothetical protein